MPQNHNPTIEKEATLVTAKRQKTSLWLEREAKTTVSKKSIYNLRKWKPVIMNEKCETGEN